ncbi:MAG: hypothetical protein HYR96_09280 [Deltaproteobacteria bacterium]|nr:hypothetical protein [Deltaproteobacteria bacterium]MBI3293576.1 hypothetical protein [Deltaproteobacteria bacterium]
MKALNSAFLFLMILAALSACSGNKDKNQLPPPCANPALNQGRIDALSLAQQTQAVCLQSASPAMMAVGQQICGGVPPGAPIMLPAPPNMQTCQQMATQLVLSLNTLYAPQGGAMYAIDFLKAQGAAFANAMGSQLQQAGCNMNNPQTVTLVMAAGAKLLPPATNPIMAPFQQMAYAGMAAH